MKSLPHEAAGQRDHEALRSSLHSTALESTWRALCASAHQGCCGGSGDLRGGGLAAVDEREAEEAEALGQDGEELGVPRAVKVVGDRESHLTEARDSQQPHHVLQRRRLEWFSDERPGDPRGGGERGEAGRDGIPRR